MTINTEIETKIKALAADVITLANKRLLTLTTAESCTGGLISAALTSISGSSKVFKAGFVTYANDAKVKMLGIEKSLLNKVGAVSEEVAIEMAKGALVQAGVDISVAVTGIAGPNSDDSEKPVGLVHIAVGRQINGTVTVQHKRENFADNGREYIRNKTVFSALTILKTTIEKE
jgi:nicotinamide-nucleotide amidase